MQCSIICYNMNVKQKRIKCVRGSKSVKLKKNWKNKMDKTKTNNEVLDLVKEKRTLLNSIRMKWWYMLR